MFFLLCFLFLLSSFFLFSLFLLSSFFSFLLFFFLSSFFLYCFLLVSPFPPWGATIFLNGAKLRKNVDTKSSRAYLFYIKVCTAAVY